MFFILPIEVIQMKICDFLVLKFFLKISGKNIFRTSALERQHYEVDVRAMEKTIFEKSNSKHEYIKTVVKIINLPK
jgi:hypothetical protein